METFITNYSQRTRKRHFDNLRNTFYRIREIHTTMSPYYWETWLQMKEISQGFSLPKGKKIIIKVYNIEMAAIVDAKASFCVTYV